MAAKLTRLTHKIEIQLHLVAESCTICSCRSSPETFGYTLIFKFSNHFQNRLWGPPIPPSNTLSTDLKESEA
jgi:hypothetical protein